MKEGVRHRDFQGQLIVKYSDVFLKAAISQSHLLRAALLLS